MIGVRGLAWCSSEAKTIPVMRATSNVLCEFHNNTLSPVDAEALEFQKALVLRLRTDGSSRHARVRDYVHLDGIKFSRWLTKTCCNLRASDHQRVFEDFVRYSFGRQTERPLWVYFHASLGLEIDVRKTEFLYRDYWDEHELIADMRFCGLRWLVSTVKIEREDRIEMVGHADRQVVGSELVEKPREIILNRAGDPYTVTINWDKNREVVRPRF